MRQTPVWEAPWCDRCGVPIAYPCHCEELASSIRRARALGQHVDWIQHGVHLLKYRDELKRAEMFGPLLATVIADLPTPDVIAPVPLHPRREIERGYNQAFLIAESLAESSGHPIAAAGTIERSINTPHQTGLPAAQRRRNLSGAFVVRFPSLIQGKRVLLIDDVMTSGATMAECARTIRQAGASSVDIVTISRAINVRR